MASIKHERSQPVFQCSAMSRIRQHPLLATICDQKVQRRREVTKNHSVNSRQMSPAAHMNDL